MRRAVRTDPQLAPSVPVVGIERKIRPRVYLPSRISTIPLGYLEPFQAQPIEKFNQTVFHRHTRTFLE